jgi:carboxyl-terminal processing protease
MKDRSRITILAFSTALTVALLIGAVLGQDRGSTEPYRPLSVLSEVLSRIQTDYVEDPAFSKVTEGALHGMLESLDSYSSYLTPEEYKEYQKGPQGDASIGAVITKRYGFARIVALLPGGAAEKAGLAPFDTIESIDGHTTRDMSYAEVLLRLEGSTGSTVTLAVVREQAQPLPIEVKRETTRVPEIESRLLEGGIGYLRSAALPKGETDKIAAKIRDLRRSGAKKFILDLRDNALGDTEEGVATANLFIKRGLLAYLEGQQHPRKSFLAEEAKAIAEEPLVVLVNDSTAGAAEIVAAAILDNHRGDVVGMSTFGIGSIQKVIPLEDGSALILSVAKYYTPVGKVIQDEGVTPNVVVEQERDFVSLLEQEEAPPAPPARQPREDAPLKRAIELLKAQDSLPRAA